MKIKPKVYKGGIAKDNRGSVAFNNGLQLKNIKRFYIVAKKKILLELGTVIK